VSAVNKYTARELFQIGVHKLNKLFLDDAQAHWETRMLLALSWQKEGVELALAMDDIVPDAVADAFIDYIERRLKWEPFQYITGETEFMGRMLKTRPGVLIARQDTEILVNEALRRLPEETSVHVLDLGTGSGNIIGSLAKARPMLQGIAVDIARQALELAKENLNSLEVESRITLLCGNWYDPLDEGQSFDMIVSNPPYISIDDMKSLPESVLIEPAVALEGGIDGMDAIRIIIEGAARRLKPDGWLLVEIGWNQGEQARRMMLKAGFEAPLIIPDTGGRSRVLVGKIQ